MNKEINIPEAADKILNGQGAKEFFKALIKNPIAVICFVLIGVVVLFGLISNLILFYGYHNQSQSLQDQNKTQVEQIVLNREILNLNKEILITLKIFGDRLEKNSEQVDYQNKILYKIEKSFDENKKMRK